MKKFILTALLAVPALMVSAQAVKYVPLDNDYSKLCTPKALSAFISQAKDSKYTAENRVIMLRNAMNLQPTLKQRKQILKEVGETGAFQGLAFAAEWLDNPDLQREAAAAVVKIALSNPEYAGSSLAPTLRKAAKIAGQGSAIEEYLKAHPGEGYVKIFNGRDLTGWKGLVDDPIKRAAMSPQEEAQKQVAADMRMRHDWKVINGEIVFIGNGFDNLCTRKKYKDFDMYVDWKLDPSGQEPDAGIYLRGTPQVQIWDTARIEVGAQVGSGGLYNNQKNEAKPSQVADNKVGEWNSFRIIMRGEKVTVYLNGVKVVDNVTLENFWDRSKPIFPVEQLELQAHGSLTYFRNIYVKEL